MVTKLVTDLKVFPTDWLTNPQSVNQPWRIWYRYKGHLVKIMGMNREKDYAHRVLLTRELFLKEKERLLKYGFDPISKTYLIDPPTLATESKLEIPHNVTTIFRGKVTTQS